MWKKRCELFLLLLPQPCLWCQVCGWWMWFAIFNRWAASQRQVVKCLDHQILSVSCITPAHLSCSFHLSVPETSLCSARLRENVQTVVSCHFCPLNFEEAGRQRFHHFLNADEAKTNPTIHFLRSSACSWPEPQRVVGSLVVVISQGQEHILDRWSSHHRTTHHGRL